MFSYFRAQFPFRDCTISFRGGSFLLAFILLGCHHIAIALWYIVGRILNMCFAHMRPPRPCREFSRLLFYFHAQFPLRDISISFQGGLFCLLFTLYAHAVGFPAYFSTSTPSFRSATYRLASGVGFLAYFCSPKPMSWVFSLVFLLSRPVFVPGLCDMFPE